MLLRHAMSCDQQRRRVEMRMGFLPAFSPTTREKALKSPCFFTTVHILNVILPSCQHMLATQRRQVAVASKAFESPEGSGALREVSMCDL